ncbi:hypothetical protein PENANT_c013G04900 [Penicillium antarcticum]|uniref:AB hydrolase-1 domain-containing protein n=1 Tax=Penicillium antarcticum TaxID=416450 RepID=A0A1V6Q4P2_9EURO|nr:uncharacterized protein N7508_004298 [Penicillium antarcticum]KAJ5308919.1 hypothetical protein N7508_004298 [Penicillium antarcticum]OQD84228.1 hypothetical protein PENANT_c013G04900 [Penicillium antarcticum]
MAKYSELPFNVTERIIDGQYIREYPAATVSQDSLKLAVKKYTPVDNPNPQPGDVTFIGAHGAGFLKELYEPLWEDLLIQSGKDGFRIRAVWIADTANLGASGIHNEEILGNDPSWFDHSRDLMCMINHFRDEMPQPIIGIGHSMGAGQLVLLSLMHPRLFASLILVEPVIAKDIFSGYAPQLTLMSLKQRDTWPSKSAAIQAASKTYKRWDSRVLERWNKHGYRSLPAPAYPQKYPENSQSDPPVTLKNSKYQEVLHYLRPNYSGKSPPEQGDPRNDAAYDPVFYPDIIGPAYATSPFYRSEGPIAWKMVKHVRPPLLYVFGEKSPMSTPEKRAGLLKRTGTGLGGNGGAKRARVKEVVIQGTGHMLPLEMVAETANAVGPWVAQEIDQWQEIQTRMAQKWKNCSVEERLKISEKWMPILEDLLKPDEQKRGSRL